MLKFLTEGVILSNILFRRPVPNPLVGYGKVYNSYVRARLGYTKWHDHNSWAVLSVSQSTSSLSVLSCICRVSCVVGYRPIALETTNLVASSMHLILNDRAECIAKVDGAVFV